MTAEQRWILDLNEILTLRLECSKCGTSVVFKPIDWHDVPGRCPGCEGYWDVPHAVGEQPTGLQQIGTGLRQILQQEKAAAKTGGSLPYRVKFEIRDPTMAKYGVSTDT